MKVLIVDDEIFSIQVLMSIIRWKSFGIEEPDQARSAAEALQKIMLSPPDILITDIRMPDSSGLELAEKVLRTYPDIKVILMSAYADFSYIREGMRLGCCDYMLKPIDETEFERTLKRVLNMIEGEKEQEEVHQKNADKVDDFNLFQYIRTGHGKNKILHLDVIRRLHEYVMLFVQISSISIDDFNSSETVEIEHEGYYTSQLEDILKRKGLIRLLNFDEGSWIAVLNGISREETIAVSTDLVDEMNNRTGHVFTVCFSGLYRGLDELHEAYREVRSLNKYGLAMVGGEETVIGMDYHCRASDLAAVEEFRKKEREEKKENGESRQYSEPVRKAIRLIEERFAENLSLDDISEELSISKNYFCYVFKRDVGMNLWNYLTEVRLRHARELLKNSELRSYEIAFEVGYDNPSYFSKLFKKYVKMTPGEYRNKVTGRSE